MYKKFRNNIIVSMLVALSIPLSTVPAEETFTPALVVEASVTPLPKLAAPPIKAKPIEPADMVSQDEIELLALVTMAEAEGECEEGKRLVIDTILNRVDSKHFPNTITEVIYQPGQFTSMWNGRSDRCYVRDDICQLVREEINNRINYDVMFFHAKRYGKWGYAYV